MKDNMLTEVVETHNIVKTPEGASVEGKAVDADSYVSMNMWGFPAEEGQIPEYLTRLSQDFVTSFRDTVPSNPMKAEYLLPIHIGGLLKQGKVAVTVLETKDKWFGVTYKEDKALVVESFRQLIAQGVYCEDLYADL